MRTIRGFFSDISTKTTIFNISGEYYN
ncbi:16S rRNA methyltransferase, partial [Francisella tularensis subsp. holarctica]|nr:16S rRNA methyltransferase [Francisella tularensis]MBN3696252.1 16S rRNA methyltransferase [Francisella tularensis subsp. holarctica]MWW93965.1 16S rRNA methyltransferase [Francisella tularensis]MWX47034.1 16S rRNA methyltransferase [Francisella tularensis]MWX61281.1 16S rRNA methyltransferase [Francisella tularensis]